MASQATPRPRQAPAPAPPAPTTLGQAGQLRVWLEAIGWSSARALARELRRGEQGEVYRPPAPAPGELLLGDQEHWQLPYSRLLVGNAARQLIRFRAGALARLLGDPLMLDLLDERVGELHREATALAKLAGKDADAQERQAQGTPGWLARVFGGGAGGALDGVLRGQERLTLVATARRTRAVADALEAAGELLAQAREYLGQLAAQRAALRATTREAADLARTATTAREAAVARAALPNDLPPGWAVHLGRALARETPETARERLLGALAQPLAAVAGAEPNAPARRGLEAEELLAAVVAGAIPAAPEPPDLAAAVSLLAGEVGADAAVLWRNLVAGLGSQALAAAPSAVLDPTGEGPGMAYLFQVLPPGQGPAVAGEGDEEVRPASFRQAEGPRARLGLVQVRTNLDLAAVLPYRQVLATLGQAAQAVNPFVLDELAHPVAADAAPDRATAPPDIRPSEARGSNGRVADQVVATLGH